MGVSTAPEQHRRGFTCRWEPLDVEAVAPATSVAVMAPALTESGPQKPDNLLSPLPSSGFLTKEQAAQVCHNREVLAKFVVSANVQPTKIDEHCLRGISKDLIRDVINSKYVNGLDSLSKLAKDSDLIASTLTELEAEDEKESGDIEDNYAKQQQQLLQHQQQQQQQLDKEEDNNIDKEKLEKENIINNQIYINNNSTNNQQQQQEEEEELEKNINNLKHSLLLTDCNIIDESDAIMSEPSACDNNDEMGFIKTNDDVLPMIPIIGNDDLSDNKNLIDDVKNIMELTNDLSSHVVGDITSNVDDILQVFKSMEENVDNNIVDTNNVNDITNDTTNIFSINEGFTSFDERVFNDVDDNIDIGDVIDQQQQHEHQQQQQQQQHEQQQQQQHLHLQQLQQLQLELQLSDENLRLQQLQVDEQQHNNERKCEFLLRRLRKIQAKIIGRHVAEECHGVLEISHNSVKKYLLQELANISGTNISQTAIKLPDIGGNINTFLHKIEKSCLAQSNSINRQRITSYRYFGAGSRDNITSGNNTNNNRHQVFGAAQVKIDGDEVENIAGSLAMQLHTVETKIDSDCTASSSGGESCDEMETYNNLQQQQLPITKRAAWKYAQDRAGIAARWTWLQAQITDLEFRIRHHNDFQRQIRSTKGQVVLKNVEPVNGYSGSLPGSTTSPSPSSSSTTSTTPLNDDDTSTASSSSCCRTRPFVWELYKKRKLIRIDGLHEYSKRAAKPSNIRCNCDHVLPSCALCTGRIDPTQPQESHEQLSLADKIALVDTSYHPVLSFPDEISHCTHFNSIMKLSDWQQKTLRGSNNNNSNRLSRNNKDKDTIDNNNRRSNKIKLSDGRSNKYTTLSSISSTTTPTTPTALATTTTLLTTPMSTATTTTPSSSSLALTSSSSRIKKSSLLTARIKRKVLKGKRDSSTHRNIIGKRKIKTHDYFDDDASIYSSSSKHSSPVSSPLPIMNSLTIPLTHITSTTIPTITTPTTTTTTPITTNTDRYTKEKSTNSHKRLRRGSYDIDNIVIPYSVAASAKPEKLQYKEILTPKWRLCGDMIKQDLKNGILHRPSQDSDSEDVSEETIALRHERSEREENKRFMNYINRLPQGRLRHPRRADSRADSGANTPDPMSPQTGDFGGDVTSPPATPSCIQETEQNNIIDGHKNSSLQYAVRRRTYSSSMRIRDENINSIADDEHEVLPYDPRLFPLTEDIYDKMLQVMPDGHWQTSDETLCLPEEEKPDDEAEIDSHESDTTESAYCDAEGDAEDPNDPEWTVGDDRDAEKERIRPTAKR